MRPAFAAVLSALVLALIVVFAAESYASCDRECDVRVQKRVAHAKWSKAVRAYGVGRLDARMRCESGGHGGYRLATTGNGFWFGLQWEPRAWYASGGRMRHGRPVGVWAMQPSALEQRYRGVVWERRHGGDPWPNC